MGKKKWVNCMKKKKWSRIRHLIIIFLARIVMWPILFFGYGFRYKRFQRDKRNYLILYNHVSAFDQIFIAYLFKCKTYYVGSDDLLTHKTVGPILKWTVNLIPYKKASTDFTILRTCRQVASENANICISPEGNRTYSGKTCHMNPTIAKMIHFLKLPVAIVNIEGAYGVQPRFAKKKRRGRCKVYVSKVIEYEEYKDLSYEELFELVKTNLIVDESIPSGPYKSKTRAEYIERAIYNCPVCGFSHFISKGSKMSCTKCGATVEYTEYKQFESLDGKISFKNIAEWYEYQEQYILNYNLGEVSENIPIFEDKGSLFKIIPRKKRELLYEDALIKLYNNRIEFIKKSEVFTIKLENIVSSGVFGKNKVNFFTKEDTFQIKSDVHFNALKYVHMVYKFKMEKGENNERFLGI